MTFGITLSPFGILHGKANKQPLAMLDVGEYVTTEQASRKRNNMVIIKLAINYSSVVLTQWIFKGSSNMILKNCSKNSIVIGISYYY